ncbi:MAG: FHIPEP family type III secretion protein [Roseibium sp.]|uniref:FHIPEP family type III secretion protein n=1 Tax=Roseibium sp. TaxID=1936156 RepID=UPI003D9C3EE7
MAQVIDERSVEKVTQGFAALVETIALSPADRNRLTKELRALLEMQGAQDPGAREAKTDRSATRSSQRPMTDVMLAEAYHDAALAGADMAMVAATLEHLRDERRESRRPFELWKSLDDSVTASFGASHHGVLAALRAQFVAQVIEADCAHAQRLFEQEDAGASHWLLQSIAEALTHWRLDLAVALTERSSRFSIEDTETFDILRRCIPFAQHYRWAESFPIYLRLGRLGTLPEDRRAELLIAAATIKQYHFEHRRDDESLFEEAQALAPDNPDVLCGLGRQKLDANDFEGAEALARRAIAAQEDHVNAYVLLGDCAFEAGIPGEAEEAYQEAIRVRPGDSNPYQMLVRLAARQNEADSLEHVVDLTERGAVAEPAYAAQIYVEAGHAFERAQRLPEAHEWYARAIAAHPRNPLGYRFKASALLSSNETDAARTVFEHLLTFDPPDANAFFGLGWIAEAQKDFVQAEKWYEEGAISVSQYAGQFRTKAAHARWQQGQDGQVKEILLALIADHPTDIVVLETIDRVIDDVARDEAQHAHDFTEGLLDAAGESYRAHYLCKRGDIAKVAGARDDALSFYAQARARDPKNAQFYAAEAVAIGHFKAWEAGRNLLSSAPPSVQKNARFRWEMALLRNAEANSLFGANRFTDAVPLYEEAVALAPDNVVLRTNLADAYEKATDWPDPLERLERAEGAMRRASELSPDDDEIGRNVERLSRLREMVRDFGSTAETIPAVTPIAMEVASDLVPYFEGQSGELASEFAQLVTDLRDKIREQFGVVLPGVRVRGNDTDMPAGSYLFMIEEVPIVMGTITKGMRFTPIPASRLQEAGLSPVPSLDPLTGQEGSFVSESEWQPSLAGQEPLWNFLDYPARHLRQVIEQNLKVFLGHQETAWLLHELSSDSALQIREDPRLLSKLTALLRALVDERVPIVALQAICDCFMDLHNRGVPLSTIAEEFRMLPEVRSRLISPSTELVLLEADQAFEEMFKAALHRDGSQAQLALLPEDCQDLLSAVRNAMLDVSDAALVLRDPELRPLARKLFSLEFPNLHILAQREIGSELAATPRRDLRIREAQT